MADLPSQIGVQCPKCGDRVVCPLKTEVVPPNPGQKATTEIRAYIPDLATPMRLHYAAKHPAPLPASRFSPQVESVIAQYSSEDDR